MRDCPCRPHAQSIDETLEKCDMLKTLRRKKNLGVVSLNDIQKSTN